MNWGAETVWAVLGIAISVVFGIWGIYLTLRQRYPGRVTFVRENVIELFDDIAKSIPGLSVTYNGEQVSNNLVLVNAAIVNTGGIDITPNMVEMPISIALPKNYQWLNARITGNSENLQTSVKITSDGAIAIDTGLMRRREFVRFHALASVPLGKHKEGTSPKRLLSENLTITHRISSTGAIEQTEFDTGGSAKSPGLMILLGAMLLIGVVTTFWIASIVSIDVLGFHYAASASAAPVDVSATLKDGKVRVRSTDDSVNAVLELKDFWARVKGVTPVREPAASFITWFSGAFWLGFPLLLIVSSYLPYRRNQRLKRIFESAT